jgi:hypothetical protein
MLKQEQSRSDDTEVYYQEKLQELKSEIERERYQHQENMRSTCADYEAIVRDLKRQINDNIDDMDKTKRGLEQEFSTALLKREDQDRSNISVIQEQKQTIDKLRQELELQSKKHATQISVLENENNNLKKRIEDVKRDYQIHIQEQDTIFKRQQQELIHAYEHRIENVMNELKAAQSNTNKSKELTKQFQFECEEQLKHKDQEVENIKKQVEDIWRGKAKELEDLKNKEWALNLEVKTLREKNETLKQMLEERKLESHEFKDQIKQALEKENSLRRELLTVQLQYEKDLDEKQEQAALKNDDIIKSFKKSRDDALAEIQEKQRLINDLKNQLKASQSNIENLNGQLKLYEELKRAGFGQQSVKPQPQMPSVSSFMQQDFRSSNKSSNLMQRERIAREIDEEFGLDNLPSASSLDSLDFDFDNNKHSIHQTLRSPQHHAHSSGSSSISLRQYNLMKEERDSLKNQVENLEKQRQQVKEVMNNMKMDLEEAQNLKDQLEEAKLIISQRESRIQVLEAQLQTIQNSSNADAGIMKQLMEQVSLLSEKVDKREDSITSTSEVTRLNSLMTDLRVDLEHQKEKLYESQAKMESLTKENTMLRAKLKEAARDLKKVIKEREKLLDISNMLKAQLNKAKADKDTSKRPKTPTRDYSKELQDRYEAKIQNLETSMRELAENNRALRYELDRLHSNHNSKAEHEDTEVIRISSSSSLNNQIANNRYSDVMFGESEEENQQQHLRDHYESRTKHLKKLDELRDSLSLSGRFVPLTERSNTEVIQSKRETPSQKKTSRILQKKTDMLNKRKELRETYH